MNKVKKLLSIGDTVYSANGGTPMTVTAMYDDAFKTEQDTFLYDEVRELFFLTKVGYESFKKRRIKHNGLLFCSQLRHETKKESTS